MRHSAQPHQLVGQVPLPRDVRLLACATGLPQPHPQATLETIRLAGAMGLRIIETVYKDLGQRHTPLRGYLANTSPGLYRQYFRSLLPRRLRGSDFLRSYGAPPERAGAVEPGRLYNVRTAVDHLLTEHEHAENFLQAMEELADAQTQKLGRHAKQLIWRRAGRLLLASHHSYRLRLELSCAEDDFIVDSLMASGPGRGVYGARITGAGGGGTVVALTNRSRAADDALLQVVAAYKATFGRALDVSEAGTPGSSGALVVGAGERVLLA